MKLPALKMWKKSEINYTENVKRKVKMYTKTRELCRFYCLWYNYSGLFIGQGHGYNYSGLFIGQGHGYKYSGVFIGQGHG